MFCAAFLGYYFLFPLALVIVFAIRNFLCLRHSFGLSLTLSLTIFAPTLFRSTHGQQRTLMKRTITITTSILLITLSIIFIAPTIVDHKDLASTHGLRHLNFQSLPGDKKV